MPATPGWAPSPRTSASRWSPSSAAPSASGCPACRASPARNTAPGSTPAAICWNSAATAKRRPAVHYRHPDLAHQQHQRTGSTAEQDPAEDLGLSHQRRHHPGPARHPQLHRHRPQTRPARPHRHQDAHGAGNPWNTVGSLPGLTPRPLPKTRHAAQAQHHQTAMAECLRCRLPSESE